MAATKRRRCGNTGGRPRFAVDRRQLTEEFALVDVVEGNVAAAEAVDDHPYRAFDDEVDVPIGVVTVDDDVARTIAAPPALLFDAGELIRGQRVEQGNAGQASMVRCGDWVMTA